MNAGELQLRPGDQHPEIRVVTGNPDSGLVRVLPRLEDEEVPGTGAGKAAEDHTSEPAGGQSITTTVTSWRRCPP